MARRRVTVVFTALLGASACGGESNDGVDVVAGTDVDVASEGDSDMASEGDADAVTEPDAVTEVDVDTALGTDAITDVDADGDAATDVATEADVDAATGEDAEVDTAEVCTPTMFYVDVDQDGYGDPATAVSACEAPAMHVADGTDCDDTKASVNPGQPQRCSDVDDDCDPSTGTTGLATFWGDDGVVTDWSTALAGGVELTSPGELRLCEGHWDASIWAKANVRIRGLGRDLSSLTGGGGNGHAVVAYNPFDLELRDLALINTMKGESTGGAVYLQGGSINVSGVLFDGNSAGRGAGIATGFGTPTSVTIRDSTFSNNRTTNDGGALLVGAGTLDMERVEFLGNVGLYSAIELRDATARLVDCAVRDNAAVAQIRTTGSSLVIEGTSPNGSAVREHEPAIIPNDPPGGAVSIFDGTATFTDVDFGIATDDNPRGDVSFGRSGTMLRALGRNTSLTCTELDCGDATEVGVGLNESGGNFLAGTVIKPVQGPLRLLYYAPYTKQTQSGCTLDFILFSRASAADGTWKVEWVGTGSPAASPGYVMATTTPELVMNPSRVYALAFNGRGAACETHRWNTDPIGEVVPGLGTVLGFAYQSNTEATYNVGDNVTLAFSASATFRTKITTGAY